MIGAPAARAAGREVARSPRHEASTATRTATVKATRAFIVVLSHCHPEAFALPVIVSPSLSPVILSAAKDLGLSYKSKHRSFVASLLRMTESGGNVAPQNHRVGRQRRSSG